MNVLQGEFYSTAFRVADDKAFAIDPAMKALLKHIELFQGEEDGMFLYCITNKHGEPGTRLKVLKPAIMGLLDDAGESSVPMEDEQGWIATLQKHLHPDYGITLFHDEPGVGEYQTYITDDCAGWTRGHD
jgi:hypothetical protein